MSLKKFRKFADDESSGDNDDTIRKAAKKLKLSSRDVKKAFLRYDEDDESVKSVLATSSARLDNWASTSIKM